ncbi:hypothetical protein PSHT_13722 [Puccinia striiformis]|uniref:Uncharacterized protein n=1 Tax=Puccinia striiformis TaxID=27350 RepID=A0A2S4UP65_9BASI|nr:hypothetical protein PSHT_13722 [Puccinia striiformis]
MARASTKSINPQANQANSTDNPLSGYKGSYGISIGRSCDQLTEFLLPVNQSNNLWRRILVLFGIYSSHRRIWSQLIEISLEAFLKFTREVEMNTSLVFPPPVSLPHDPCISMGVGFINGRMRGAEYTNSQHAAPTPHGTNTLDFQAAFGLVPKQGSFGDSEWDQEHPHHHIKSDPQKGWAALSRKVGTVNPLSNALITVVPPSKHSFYETSSHQRNPAKQAARAFCRPPSLFYDSNPPATGGSYWIPILDLEEDQSVLNKRRMNHAAEDLHQARVSLIDRNDQLLMNKESLGSFHNPRSILHCISALNHHPTNSHNTLTSQIYQEREQLVTLLLFNQKLNMKFA